MRINKNKYEKMFKIQLFPILFPSLMETSKPTGIFYIYNSNCFALYCFLFLIFKQIIFKIKQHKIQRV